VCSFFPFVLSTYCEGLIRKCHFPHATKNLSYFFRFPGRIWHLFPLTALMVPTRPRVDVVRYLLQQIGRPHGSFLLSLTFFRDRTVPPPIFADNFGVSSYRPSCHPGFASLTRRDGISTGISFFFLGVNSLLSPPRLANAGLSPAFVSLLADSLPRCP